MKNIWILTLVSKDNQKYEFKTLTFSEKEAIKNAFANIEKKGWSNYGYEVLKTEKMGN